MRPLIALRDALADDRLLGGAIPGDSWRPWRVLLIAAMGEELTDEERDLFNTLTGREREPLQQVEELWAIVGRRGGKTRGAGTLAAYVAGLCEHDYLAPGERAVLPILAATVSQAGRAFMHAKGILETSPTLREEIDGEPTTDTIRLHTRVDIEVRPANFRTIRSITAPMAVADEVAFWNLDGSANPDAEILNGLRPALATTGGPLVVISSPYARRGELYATYKRDYGPEGDPLVLVAKGPSRLFNSTLSQRVVDRAYQRDPAAAGAEYGGEFRTDVEALLTIEAVEACVARDVRERAPLEGVTYVAFADPSGGSSDSMTLAIGHVEAGRAVLDAVREIAPPFSPKGAVDEFAALLKLYGLRAVTGDRYAGLWPRERFAEAGITYQVAQKPKSDLYLGLVSVINSGSVDLLDLPKLTSQFVGLERRTARGGRDTIDHAPGAHDDVANAVAGFIHLAMIRPSPSAPDPSHGVEVHVPADPLITPELGDEDEERFLAIDPSDGW